MEQTTLTDTEPEKLINREKPVCPECGKCFDSLNGLRNHYAKLSGDGHSEPYPWWEEAYCGHCGDLFYKNHTKHNKIDYCSKKCSALDRSEYMRTNYVSFKLENASGYPSWSMTNGSTTVHQLLAVANGADPYKVYGNDQYNIDHKNGCKIDNRPQNVRLMPVSEHGVKAGNRQSDMSKLSHSDVLSIFDYFTPLGGDPSWLE